MTTIECFLQTAVGNVVVFDVEVEHTTESCSSSYGDGSVTESWETTEVISITAKRMEYGAGEVVTREERPDWFELAEEILDYQIEVEGVDTFTC